MSTSPVVEWRAATTPFGTLSTLALTGSGSGNAIPMGTSSAQVSLRIYNNFAGATGVVDATNCVLAVYDDTTHQGTAVNPPSTSLYVQVQVLDYNGGTTGADTFYYAIGGQVKHALPVNSGTLGGGSSNYVTVSVQVVIPTNATQGSVSQGLWVEYNATA